MMRNNALVNTLAEVFILASLLGLVSLVVVNGIAIALGHWTAVLFRASCVIALIPQMLAGAMCARLQLTRLVAAFEEATQYDLNRDGVIGNGDSVRLIPVRGGPLVDDAEEHDLRVFVKAICSDGDWTQARWRNKQLPSGRVCDDEYLNALIGPLVKAGFIQGRAPRVTGRLVERDPMVILDALGID